MGYRLGCPKCKAWTSSVFRAFEAGENCPYCGGDINNAENAAHFIEQLLLPPTEPTGHYLIHLGHDIVKCPGGRSLAEEHLKEIRAEVIELHRQATGRNPDTVPWLIGVYPESADRTGTIGYGYTPTMFGERGTPRSEWRRDA
jgi:hypothetical protein